MDITFSPGSTDKYSDVKLQKIKKQHPVLTYSVLCTLRAYGLTEADIRKMYGVSRRYYFFFKENHYQVLKEVHDW